MAVKDDKNTATALVGGKKKKYTLGRVTSREVHTEKYIHCVRVNASPLYGIL